MAHIKKAIADVESGNPVAFATGKVQIYSTKIVLGELTFAVVISPLPPPCGDWEGSGGDDYF